MILSTETVLRLTFVMLAILIMIGCVCCVWLQRYDIMRKPSSVKIRVCRHHPEDRAIHGMAASTVAPESNRHPMLEPDNSRNTDTKKHAWFDSPA